MDSVIRTFGLSKRFGKRRALDNVDLEVPAGMVFGYLGPNGAGKTTTMRILAGLIRPTTGRAEVLGTDCVTARDHVQRRLGYLPGSFVAYRDLTGGQYLRYLDNLRGGGHWGSAQDLAKRLDLDLTTRIGTLSHGNKQKVGIVQAFMHRPDVILLDEPTAGLDPLGQREFLDLVRETAAEGRTVFLSSHVLSEVEAVAERIGMLRNGKLVVVESVDRLKRQALHRIDLTFEQPPPVAALRAAPGVRDAALTGPTVHLAIEGSPADVLQLAAPYRISRVVSREPDLEEIFMTYYGEQG